MAYWQGRESFHAGAVAVGDVAWGFVGERGAGKSATLAALSARGHTIVCDDMLVLDQTTALAGPRCIDLRQDAAKALGMGVPLGCIGTRERWRVEIAPVEPELELRGWIFLEWGAATEVASVSASERLGRLLAQRGTRLPPRDDTALLDVARLPGRLLRRPRAFRSLPETLDRLLEAIV